MNGWRSLAVKRGLTERIRSKGVDKRQQVEESGRADKRSKDDSGWTRWLDQVSGWAGGEAE